MLNIELGSRPQRYGILVSNYNGITDTWRYAAQYRTSGVTYLPSASLRIFIERLLTAFNSNINSPVNPLLVRRASNQW